MNQLIILFDVKLSDHRKGVCSIWTKYDIWHKLNFVLTRVIYAL